MQIRSQTNPGLFEEEGGFQNDIKVESPKKNPNQSKIGLISI